MREKTEQKQNLDKKLGYLPITDSGRVNVLLTTAGLKRATDIEIPFGRETPLNRISIHSEKEMGLVVTRTRQILRTMGLAMVEAPEHPHAKMFQQDPNLLRDRILYAAREREDAERLAQIFPQNMRGEGTSEQKKELGKLFGFPLSAVEAYSTTTERGSEDGTLMKKEGLPAEIREEDAIAFLWFRLSKEHWREEMETVRMWAKTVKGRAPELYARCVHEYKTRQRRLPQRS